MAHTNLSGDHDVLIQFHECMPMFIALGDEIRLRIMELITTAYYESGHGMNVKDITERTCLSRPAISHHLKILKDAGIINVRQEGTCNYYYPSFSNCAASFARLGNKLRTLFP